MNILTVEKSKISLFSLGKDMTMINWSSSCGPLWLLLSHHIHRQHSNYSKNKLNLFVFGRVLKCNTFLQFTFYFFLWICFLLLFSFSYISCSSVVFIPLPATTYVATKSIIFSLMPVQSIILDFHHSVMFGSVLYFCH